MDELTTTTGIVALAASATALICLVLVGITLFKLRRLRKNQSLVLGESGERDLVAHAEEVSSAVELMRDFVDELSRKFESRIESLENKTDGCISGSAVIRYDAYKEMGGQQSTSLALIDENGSGIVLSSILHREQARVYVKELKEGRSDVKLSPEESAAVLQAGHGEDNKGPK